MQINFQINISRPRWTRNWSLKRKVMVFLALALVLPPAAFVAASDIFSDVPNDHPFTNDIDAIYGARITSGTTATTFSPEALPTRGQIAAFLHRGLPRVAYNAVENKSLTSFGFNDTAVVTINTGGASGGTGLVKLDASLTAKSLGCPCRLVYRIVNADESKVSPAQTVWIREGVGVSVDDQNNTSGSLTWALTVPTASTQSFRLQVYQPNLGAFTPPFIIQAELTALYVPFGSAGTATLAAQSVEPQAVSEAQELKPQTDKGNKQ